MSSCTNCHGADVEHTSSTCPENEAVTDIHTEIEEILESLLISCSLSSGIFWDKDDAVAGPARERATQSVKTLLTNAQAEGYKRGYIAGGIEELNKLTPTHYDHKEYVKDRLNQLNKENEV